MFVIKSGSSIGVSIEVNFGYLELPILLSSSLFKAACFWFSITNIQVGKMFSNQVMSVWELLLEDTFL